MGRKIFVSYKYADDKVKKLSVWGLTTVRDYVDKFEKVLEESDNIYRGESDGEDLRDYSEDTIWKMLKDRIFDSSVTVVFISPGMKEDNLQDKDQWIPWEISFSLKETSRKTKSGDSVRVSHTNAMLAVVLPDENGSYAYYLEQLNCCKGQCIQHHTGKLFKIIKNNKFNRSKNSLKKTCEHGTVWSGTCSYIEAVKWEDFIGDYEKYINNAIERRDCIDEYEICKSLD